MGMIKLEAFVKTVQLSLAWYLSQYVFLNRQLRTLVEIFLFGIWFIHLFTLFCLFVCSVTTSCLTLWDPMGCSMPVFPVLHCLLEFAQIHVHRVGDIIQPSYSMTPLLLLPSIIPSIRVFSKDLALYIRWLKYWSFSFRIIPSSEYSGLFSFRIDWEVWSPCCPRNS